MCSTIATILENEYFKLYTIENNIYIDSQPTEVQEKYESHDVLSYEEKLKRIDQLLEYFYNLWKVIESANNNTMYTLNFNVHRVMFHVPPESYLKIKKVFESLNKIFEKHLKETFVKVENNIMKHFFDLILTFYKPVKPVHTYK